MNQIETSKPRRSLEKQSLDGDTRKRVKWNKRGANREREKKCPQSISGKEEEEEKEVWYTKQVMACHCGTMRKTNDKREQF